MGIILAKDDEIFVFGSNLSGIHGAGAARFAYLNYGAQYGIGIGHVGNSYAIPTKDETINTLPLSRINEYVDKFIMYAVSNPDLIFKLTPIGCGLAGYSESDIAPMFKYVPNNIILPQSFIDFFDSLGD